MSSDCWRVWLIAVLLALATLAAYRQVGKCDFVTFDDPSYVFDEPMVNAGLRSASFVWAFTASHSGNWHPLTSLSHMLDCSFFGVAPAPMHWENVFWHVINAMLVFLVWRMLTGSVWPSALVAALFALHPLHVESVAWISERKDVLSGFFFLLTLLFYVCYARGFKVPGSRFKIDYAFALVCFAMGLLSKPMLVTLPFVLLLLDFWPLGRVSGIWWKQTGVGCHATRITSLLLEKIPFFALAGIVSLITFLVQRSSGAMTFGVSLGFAVRLGNALVSYTRYLGKMFWPDSLAIFYPHPGSWPAMALLGALILIVGMTGFALRQARSRPWIVFGLLWFLVTLVPVIGLVQVGGQSMADRYTYIPLLGIFTVVAWTMAEVGARWPKTRVPLGIASVLVLSACVGLTQKQVSVWRNGVTLFEHNLASTKDNVRARLYLADALEMAGRPEAEVASQCRRALEVEPGAITRLRIQALMQLSRLAAQHQRFDEARSFLDEAHQLERQNAGIDHALGLLSLAQGRPDDAATHFSEALRLDPSRGATRRELAKIFFDRKRLDESRAQLEAAIEADRWDYLAHGNLAVVLKYQGRIKDSVDRLEHVLWINPNQAEAHAELGNLLLRQRDWKSAAERERNSADAAAHFYAAIKVKPDYADALNDLAWLLATEGKLFNPAESVRLAKRACEVTQFRNVGFLDTLAVAYASNLQTSEAILMCQKALALLSSDPSANPQLTKVLEGRLRELSSAVKETANPLATASPPAPPRDVAFKATHPLVWDAMEKTLVPSSGAGKVEFTFWVTNTSVAEVTINQLSPSCNCTVPSIRLPWKLAPGASGPVAVAIDIKGKSGNLGFTIAVISTAGDQTLTMNINVPAIEAVNPLGWDAMEKTVVSSFGDTKVEFTFWVTNTSTTTDVIINRLFSNCDCTKSSTEVPWKLAAGVGGPMKATVDIKGQSGNLVRTITVISTAGFQTLTMNINVPKF